MTKIIPLPGGKEAFVDDKDYKELSKYNWHYDHGYASRNITRVSGSKHVYMHRQILSFPEGMEIDHINLDRLDNRRENLRICTRTENSHNMPMLSTNTSGYKGVTWDKANNKWIAQIDVNKKHMNLGRFTDIIEAARAYNEAAIKHHGEFATTNLVEG